MEFRLQPLDFKEFLQNNHQVVKKIFLNLHEKMKKNSIQSRGHSLNSMNYIYIMIIIKINK